MLKTSSTPKTAPKLKSGYIHPSGSTTARIWIIVDQPFDSDADKGYIFSGGAGYTYRKMLEDAGITDYRICARRPDLEHPDAYAILENELNQYRPPIVIALDQVGLWACPNELTPTRAGSKKQSNLENYAGSLLKSPILNYEHYVIPTYGPMHVLANWSERDIITSLDLGKAQAEVEYYKQNCSLESLPNRTLYYDLQFNDLMAQLQEARRASLLSVDIETIYNNRWEPNSYPITIGIATSASRGFAFPAFGWSVREQALIWRELDYLFRHVQVLGQNFFNFDMHHFEALGFEFKYTPLDTMIRHALLWPELPHDLGFMVRQYTREPFHKDSGHGWTTKNLKPLLKYNALDCCTTYEVYEAQELELQARGIAA